MSVRRIWVCKSKNKHEAHKGLKNKVLLFGPCNGASAAAVVFETRFPVQLDLNIPVNLSHPCLTANDFIRHVPTIP